MGFNMARISDDGKLIGGYATIWKVEDKGKYSSVQLSTSRKKDDGTYENDFSGFVNFVGRAHQMAQGITGMTRIQIKNADVTKRYVKEQDKEYYNFAVFDFDFQDAAPSSKPNPKPKSDDFMNIPDGDDDQVPWLA